MIDHETIPWAWSNRFWRSTIIGCLIANIMLGAVLFLSSFVTWQDGRNLRTGTRIALNGWHWSPTFPQSWLFIVWLTVVVISVALLSHVASRVSNRRACDGLSVAVTALSPIGFVSFAISWNAENSLDERFLVGPATAVFALAGLLTFSTAMSRVGIHHCLNSVNLGMARMRQQFQLHRDSEE